MPYRLLYVTNRNKTPSGGFGLDLGENLSFGGTTSLDADMPVARPYSESSAFYDELKQTLSAGRDVVLFVHGYYSGIGRSLVQGRDIGRRFGEGSLGSRDIVVFAWPSDEKVFSYNKDKRDAGASGFDIYWVLKRLLDIAATIAPGERGKISVMCQSFGNYAFLNSIKYLARDLNLAGTLSEIVLAAPVISRHAFTLPHELEPLPDLANRVSLYFNPHDPGKFAAILALEFHRMAIRGPRRAKDLEHNVAVINCDAAIPSTLEDIVERQHRYLFSSESVLSDVNAVLNGTDSDLLPRRLYKAHKNHYLLQES